MLGAKHLLRKLLHKIAAPLTATGRQYNIDPKDRGIILNLWKKILNNI